MVISPLTWLTGAIALAACNPGERSDTNLHRGSDYGGVPTRAVNKEVTGPGAKDVEVTDWKFEKGRWTALIRSRGTAPVHEMWFELLEPDGTKLEEGNPSCPSLEPGQARRCAFGGFVHSDAIKIVRLIVR